jgi:hypothetical protein
VTISILTGPAGGTLLGTTTVTAVNGVAKFSGLRFNTAGTYTLQATSDGLGGASPLNTIHVAIPASATQTPTKLAFATQPSSAKHNKSISPALTVLVENARGQAVTNDNSTVTLTIRSGPKGGELLGTLKAVARHGVAVFSSVKLSLKGKYRLMARDESLTSAESQTFKIK